MEEELKNLIKVWFSAIISISYCYYLPPKIKTGFPRLLSLLPICVLFLVFPMFLSSVHFSDTTAFFLSFLANVKLILFCFDQGPLFPLPPNLTRFICLTCLPINLQQNPKSQNHLPKWVFPIKVAIFTVVLHAYKDKQYLPPVLLWGLYPLHLYLEHEMFLALIKYVVSITLKCELEPQFNEPYLATSLQDFWGRRWNLMVSATLRSGVYNPVRQVCKYLIRSDYATLVGVLVTFLMSGLAHEVVSFFLTREGPTWEATCFFVLHGVCTATEVAIKKTAFGRRWRMKPVVSRLLTVGFVVVTSGWLFFAQFMRSGVMERRANETFLFIDFFKRKFLVLLAIMAKTWNYVS